MSAELKFLPGETIMMHKSALAVIFSSLGGLLFLASCVGTGGSSIANEYSTSCMFEVNPPGSYVFNGSDDEVKPMADGTAEGAAAMNACIRRKAAEAGKETVVAEKTGATTVTQTYTYGTPPASAASATAPGALAPSAPAPSNDGKSCRRRNVLSGGSGYFGCVN